MTAIARSPYSRAAIVLHWVMALMILANLGAGFFLEDLFNADDPALRDLGFQLVQLHKSVGLTVLTLAVVRLALRVREGFPPLPAHMTVNERRLARVTHGGFYVLMLGLPMTGWLMSSASPLGFPTFWFGLFQWPNLPVPTSEELSKAFGNAHEVMAWVAVALLVLHVAGALKHHFLDRDDVLARMIPLLRPRQG
ncbi:MAG: cytochrome b [Thermaurantiacus sp.]